MAMGGARWIGRSSPRTFCAAYAAATNATTPTIRTISVLPTDRAREGEVLTGAILPYRGRRDGELARDVAAGRVVHRRRDPEGVAVDLVEAGDGQGHLARRGQLEDAALTGGERQAKRHEGVERPARVHVDDVEVDARV